MKRIRYISSLLCIVLPLLLLSGCAKKESMNQVKDENFSSPTDSEVSYSDGFRNLTNTSMYYWGQTGKVSVMDFETMNSSILCDKPNCSHTTSECLANQIGPDLPVFGNGSIYYFIDDVPKYGPTDEHIVDLTLGTSLFEYDFSKHRSQQIAHIDHVGVNGNCQGVLYYNNRIWFVGNWYGRVYDENGSLISSGNSGGRYELLSVDLNSKEVVSYGDLYDVDAIAEYYPGVTSSGDIALKGLFDNKLWFEVSFVDDGKFHYRSYVTCYDLEKQAYLGTPTDYSAIDFKAVSFLSKEYLVLSKDHEMSVYKEGSTEPIVVTDDSFSEAQKVSVFDDILFANERVFDLNTGECRMLPSKANSYVIAEYKDNYLIENSKAVGVYHLILKSEYLAG